MAISINKPGKDTINPPYINLTGSWVNPSTGQVSSTRRLISIGSQDIEHSGLEVNNRDEIVFYDKISVSFIPDQEWPIHAYQNLKKYNEVTTTILTIEGSNETKTKQYHNLRSETYYTLNGKSPKRTKGSLYTGPFDIKQNTSGDNIILKVRTYVAGRKSKVRTVQLRLIKKSYLIVNG